MIYNKNYQYKVKPLSAMRLRLIGRLCIYLLFSIFILRAHTLMQHNLSIKYTCINAIYSKIRLVSTLA